MNNYKIIVVTLILTAVLSLPACGGAPVNQPDSEDITPQSHAETNLSLVAVSDEWELEITGAIWGGDSSMIQIGEGQNNSLYLQTSPMSGLKMMCRSLLLA